MTDSIPMLLELFPPAEPPEFRESSERETYAHRAQPAPQKTKGRQAALSFCVLGSGSGGNCSVVRTNQGAVLIDAGFGPATVARRLRQAGMSLEDVRALCVTHLDQDHFRPLWIKTLLGWKIPLYLHRWQCAQLHRHAGAAELENAGLVRCFQEDAFQPAPEQMTLTFTPVSLPHDHKGTSGFHVEHRAIRIGFATDLGHVPKDLLERFAGVDLLAIESNYDPPMQVASARPLFLKRRVMGALGHLSNQQAFEAVRTIAERSPAGNPRQVVLLHRSSQCNDPQIIRRTFAQDPELGRRVVLTEQRRRTRWFHLRPLTGVERHQMRFDFGTDCLR